MRKLNGGDLFNALRMLRALDLKGVVEAYSKTANAKTDEDKQAANMALFDRLVSNASDPESEEVLFSWLAGPLENPAPKKSVPCHWMSWGSASRSSARTMTFAVFSDGLCS